MPTPTLAPPEADFRRTTVIDVLLLALLVLPAFGPYLVGDEGALGRDYGSVFLDAMHQQNLALQDGRVLLWDSSQLGGTAHWARPNTAPVYPPLALSMLAFGSLEGLNVTLYLQVLFGGLGTYLLVRRLTAQRFAALVAGLLFAYAYFSRHLAEVLPLEFMALTWIPWVLLFTVRAIAGPDWLRPAILAGCCYSAIPWIGGYILFLPGLLTVGTAVLTAHLRAPLARNLPRAAGMLAVFFATFLGVSAARILPMQAWIELTNRAEGITREFALDGTLSLADMLDWGQREGWTALVLLSSCALLRVRRRFDWALPMLAIVGLVLAISNGDLYALLFDYVPGFDRVREPRRSWLLMPALLSPAAGLGLAAIIDRLHPRGWAWPAVVVVVLGAVAVDLHVYARYEGSPAPSLSERIANNALHQDLARRAAEEPPFRVIDYDKSRTRPKRTADVMRSFLGLQSLEGILGNIEIEAYGDGYLMWAREDRARLWGLMNCRYVTSEVPRDEPGLSLVGWYQPDPERIVRGMDGPYLYRNELELPRAFLTDRMLLLVGDSEPLWRSLVLKPGWDPTTLAMAWVSADELAQWPDERLDQVSGALLFEVDPGLAARVREHTSTFELSDASRHLMTGWLASLFEGSTESLRPVAPSLHWNTETVVLPADARGRWLVLAETYALFPGWSATVDGVDAPVLRANAVATAVPLPDDAREVALHYRPKGLASGSAISAGTLLLVAWLVLRRRRVPTATAA